MPCIYVVLISCPLPAAVLMCDVLQVCVSDWSSVCDTSSGHHEAPA